MRFDFSFPYTIQPAFKKKVAYFCMEYGIHQPLKIYAGGLGFLAGSHLRSAYELQQPIVGVGILWKYGYYDQVRKQDQSMDVLFAEKIYGFLVPTGIKFTIKVSGHDVWVTAYYLPPAIFKTAPLFLLSTDLEENDYLAKTISHRLYDANPETRLAAAILLGAGGARLLEELGWEPDVYHLNESHGLPLAFYLYEKYASKAALKSKLVFTNHTPETSGNQKTPLSLLEKMGFWGKLSRDVVQKIAVVEGQLLDHTLTALQLSGKANAVSKKHLETICNMWKGQLGSCNLISITNAQNFQYWHDEGLYAALAENNDAALLARKQTLKLDLFEEVADQDGEIYDPHVFTIVFAKRFAGYKRHDLLLQDMDRFRRLVTNKERPVQFIWAGKPYPMDYTAIGVFDKIVDVCRNYGNCSILAGYELKLSKLLKKGADLWLNMPRITHEASGTSGMAAAMNGAVNAGLPDGWFPEFALDTINSFVVPASDAALPDHVQDEQDAAHLFDVLEKTVLPMYYDHPDQWLGVMKNSLRDIDPQFGSNRMVQEYYDQLYS